MMYAVIGLIALCAGILQGVTGPAPVTAFSVSVDP